MKLIELGSAKEQTQGITGVLLESSTQNFKPRP